jgi:hypothetical protein
LAHHSHVPFWELRCMLVSVCFHNLATYAQGLQDLYSACLMFRMRDLTLEFSLFSHLSHQPQVIGRLIRTRKSLSPTVKNLILKVWQSLYMFRSYRLAWRKTEWRHFFLTKKKTSFYVVIMVSVEASSTSKHNHYNNLGRQWRLPWVCILLPRLSCTKLERPDHTPARSVFFFFCDP